MTDKTLPTEEELAAMLGELLHVAATYRTQPFAAGAAQMAAALKAGGTSRDDLANAVAILTLKLAATQPHPPIARLSESDRRLNVTGRLLAVVSGFGGERLVADNPAMPRMIDQLADEATDGFLRTAPR